MNNKHSAQSGKVSPISSLTIAVPMAIAASMSPNALGQQESMELEEILVTARKREENIQEVPMTVSAFNEDAIKQLQIKSVTDLQNSVSNLYIAETGAFSSGSTNVSIRGIGPPFGSAFEPSVAVYIDDAYMLSDSGQLVDLVDVAQVEVLKGPQGTLYGRNTTAGAIKFTSRRPSEEFSGSIEAQVGSEDLVGVKATVSGPLTDTLSGLATVLYRDRDGFQEDVNTGEDYWTEELGGARVALAWNPTDRFSASFSYSYFENDSVSRAPSTIASPYTREEELQIAEAAGILLPAGLEAYEFLQNDRATDAQFGDEDDVSANQPLDDFNVESTFASLVLDYEINDNWAVKSITSYFDGEHFFVLDVDGSAHDYVDVRNDEENEEFSQEFQVSFTSERVNVVAGIYYFENERELQSEDQSNLGSSLFNLLTVAAVQDIFTGVLGSKPSVEDTINMWLPAAGVELLPGLKINEFYGGTTEELESKAAFFNLDWDITDNLTLNLGGRYTDDEKEFTEVTQFYTTLGGLFIDGTGSQYWYDDRIPGATEAMAAQLGDPLFTQPGFMIDDGLLRTKSKGDWDNFDYLVGLSYNIEDFGMVYGSVSTGFKSGGFNGSDAGSQQIFDEETVTAYALGFKSTMLDGRLLFNVELFRNDIEDVQFRNFVFVQDEEGNSSLDTITGNFGEAETQGVDMTLGYVINDNWRVDLNVGYLDADIEESLEQQIIENPDGSVDVVVVDAADFMEMGRAPEWTGNISSLYNIPLGSSGDVELFVQYAYTDETAIIQPTDTRVAIQKNTIADSVGLWHAQATWYSADRNWRVFVAGKNLGDERELADAVDIGINRVTGGYNSPRTWSAGVEYSW